MTDTTEQRNDAAKPAPSGRDTFVHSYQFLRRAIGGIGVAFPFVVVLGKFVLSGGGLLDSLSGYYYSDMRNVFVGSLCAVGVFLLSYRGYDKLDEIAGDVAALGAVGVALCPTYPAHPTNTQFVLGTLHIIFAALFFGTIAFFCLVLFTRTDAKEMAIHKRARNGIYYVSGTVIIACLVLIPLADWLLPASWHAVLWLETIAIEAFGIAWLIKGETLLRDR